jgi:hypothetical protein
MDPVVDQTIRLGFGLLLLAAAVHKVRDVGAFRRTLDGYRLVPGPLVPRIAAIVIVSELGLAALLVGGAAREESLLGGGALVLAYAGAIALNLWRGRRSIDCGCVGIAGHQGLSWWLVGRNVVVAGAALTGLVPIASRPWTWIDQGTVVAATLALAGLYLATDGLIANLPAYRHLRRVA